ncbi:MAG: ABC transporter permease [Pseudomonadota bacterium]
MLQRILAIFHARNLEFLRDRSSLAWNLFMPCALILGMTVIFSGDDRAEYTVGVLGSTNTITHPFGQTRYIDFVAYEDADSARQRLARHQLDLLIADDVPLKYWVNPDSPNGYFLEQVLRANDTGDALRQPVSGDAIRYVDWLVPGILGMNMMFSCLFGVGYVVVRYRKNGFLKRLKATPLSAAEFVIAQVGSRLALSMLLNTIVFIAVTLTLDVPTTGSFIALAVIAFVGHVALISLGLLVASRISSEELAGGMLNLLTWPMMLMSGVWFSLEGSAQWLQQVAKISPLTQILDGARMVMLDGAGLGQVLPQIATLCVMCAIFLTSAAFLFRWGDR